jgi:hypothetical protein
MELCRLVEAFVVQIALNQKPAAIANVDNDEEWWR